MSNAFHLTIVGVTRNEENTHTLNELELMRPSKEKGQTNNAY